MSCACNKKMGKMNPHVKTALLATGATLVAASYWYSQPLLSAENIKMAALLGAAVYGADVYGLLGSVDNTVTSMVAM